MFLWRRRNDSLVVVSKKKRQNRRPPSYLPPPNGNDATANIFSPCYNAQVQMCKEEKEMETSFHVSFSHAGTNCLGLAPKPLSLFCDPNRPCQIRPPHLSAFPSHDNSKRIIITTTLSRRRKRRKQKVTLAPFSECRSSLGTKSTIKTFNKSFYFARNQLKKQNFQHTFVESLLTLSQ